MLLSRCFSVKSLYLRWFKFEVASPYRRPINLKQTVKVSSLITVQSVPRFFSPTRLSLCFVSVVNPPFLLMPLRLGYSWNRILTKHVWHVKDCTRLAPLFQQPCATGMNVIFCFFQYLCGTKLLNGQLAKAIPT